MSAAPSQARTPPRRVLWLAKGLGRGGAEQLLVTGAAHLDRTRFQVEVAYLLESSDALVSSLRDRGLPVHCLHQESAADLRWVVRLRRLVREGRFDIVHTHMPLPAAAARVVLAPGGPLLVHTEHNVWQRYRLPTRWVNALTYRRNAAVLAVSQAVADSVHPLSLPRGRPVEVLLHGIEASAVHSGEVARGAARDRLGLLPAGFVIGTVGTMTTKKDQATLYRAVASLTDSGTAATLVHVGVGPLEDDLRRLAGSLRLPVAFTGLRSDVPEILPAFDVFCLSSVHEGLPISMLEAMAAGLPVVVTRVGGMPEVVTEGQEGLLVPPSSVAALTAALARLIADPELRDRMGEAAQKRSLDFDITRAVARIEDVYTEILASR